MDESKTLFNKVMEKHAEKKAKAEARKVEREEQGIVNKLVIDRTPSGLYTCRYSMHGPVPDELKGFFTRKERILAVAARRNIPVENSGE